MFTTEHGTGFTESSRGWFYGYHRRTGHTNYRRKQFATAADAERFARTGQSGGGTAPACPVCKVSQAEPNRLCAYH